MNRGSRSPLATPETIALEPTPYPRAMPPGRTVLIVEPDAAARFELRAALEGDGYTVVATVAADDALSVADNPSITLVITELYLGNATSRCLLSAIGSLRRRRRPKLLAYTRHGRAQDRAWAIAAGADGYVLKRNGRARLLEVAGRLSRARTKLGEQENATETKTPPRVRRRVESNPKR